MLKITKTGKWQLYWGNMPLPEGSESLGVVNRSTLDTGALIRLANGNYVQGNAGGIRTLDRKEVDAALARSEAAAALGSKTGGAKADAARENGKRGGRPRKQVD